MLLFINYINYIIVLLLTAIYFVLKDMDSSSDSKNSVLDNPTTKKRRQTRQFLIERECQFQSYQPTSRFSKPKDRIKHNAKGQKCQNCLTQNFETLRKCCSNLNSNRREPKHSILLAAKNECDLLKDTERKMLAEKKICREANENLKNKLYRRQAYSNNGCK